MTGSGYVAPGARVRMSSRPDWGTGQVQSVVGARVTVNFENTGKQVLNTGVVALDVIEEARPPRG
ncbi:DUF3553 domain-containing protein [Roseospira navarrensis]|uniref:DUF3553 domain-containing protein n=2 Tax=Roseospira navarrensis TaxID=140058 RepID=A0A7X2D6I9_9PROT|nr:DUF3553 domain-containing protein [Roseospira navarrensis]MQX38305.1 DUF3553 domain-containing protein [Roseospira navarrensis]